MIMKTKILKLTVLMLTMNTVVYCQSLKERNIYAYNAMSKAVNEYFNQKTVPHFKNMVLRMKIMKINESSGVFVLSYIVNDGDYGDLNPSHYLFINDMLILVKIDKTCKGSIENFGIGPITDSIKTKAYDILAGPNLSITGQPSPDMVVKYKYRKVKTTFYYGTNPPKKKYWF